MNLVGYRDIQPRDLVAVALVVAVAVLMETGTLDTDSGLTLLFAVASAYGLRTRQTEHRAKRTNRGED